MSRVTAGSTTRKRHKKILGLTKGYRHGRKNLFRLAKQAVLKAGSFAYRDRRVKKRQFRSEWIVTLNAAIRQHDMSYSRFINGLSRADINLNRRVLAELAKNNPDEFSKIVEKVKKADSIRTADTPTEQK